MKIASTFPRNPERGVLEISGTVLNTGPDLATAVQRTLRQNPDHLVAGLQQTIGQMRAQKAAATGD